jgi:signal transduction histidine kinase
MTGAPRRKISRSVATRVLASYVMILIAFSLAAGWSVLAQRRAAAEANLMRSGYFPLALAVRDLVAKQDTWNSQLNHITTAKNPADIRVWFDFALRIGRPKMFGEVKAAINRTFNASGDDGARRVGVELMLETGEIEQFLAGDAERLSRLFEALDRNDQAAAERVRDELVTRGSQGLRRMSRLEQRVQYRVDVLLDAARERERLAIRLLIVLAGLTVLVGILMALYARRVLSPLALVTERAKAVASGDLKPRPAVDTKDEIGELAKTFEGMVSAIARANEQLVAAERLATIGKMAAHVTHEIRNPLSSIALNLELLEEDLANAPPEAQALLKAIGKEVDRLSALSGQYLAFARRQPLRFESEDVGEIVREAADFVRREFAQHKVEIALRVDPELPRVNADEGQLKQAVFNLLRNAREAMPSGGEVTVSVVRAVGGGVDVTIEDQGTGIDDEARARLFEPFFTTKSHGTGLGLAITRQIIEVHSGSIACEPRHGGPGTRIWLHLPEAAPLQAQLNAGSGGSEGSRPSGASDASDASDLLNEEL